MDCIISPANILPKHLAIVMDGNGRWAQRNTYTRLAGHKAGVRAVKEVIATCLEQGIKVLTLFAFSSENWKRPRYEVDGLMSLFVQALRKELQELHQQGVRLRFIGDHQGFSPHLSELMAYSESLTQFNQTMQLMIAVNYGGRWEILQAVRRLASDVQTGQLGLDKIDEASFQRYLCFSDLPPPDLLIRTSGEQRISNFLLWHLAYTELYFSPVYWPDFGKKELKEAFHWYASRERRFGLTSQQMQENEHA